MINLQDEDGSVLQNYLELKRAMAVSGIEPPFDPIRLVSPNPMFYEADEQGELIGQTVQFNGGTVTSLDGVKSTVSPIVGIVVGHANDRIVILIPGLDLYCGWLGEDEYRVLDVFHHTTSSCWLH